MNIKRIRIATALAAVAVLASTQAAFAVNAVEIDGTTVPQAPVTFTGTTNAPGSANYRGPFSFESNYGVPAICGRADANLTFTRGASTIIGTKIGKIDDSLLSNCSATSLTFPVTTRQKAMPTEWPIYLAESLTKGQRVAKVEIRNVTMQMTNTVGIWTCAVNFTGTVKATIDAFTDRLIIDTPTLSSPNNYPVVADALDTLGTKGGATTSSCGGELWDGDLMSMVGVFQLDHDIAF